MKNYHSLFFAILISSSLMAQLTREDAAEIVQINTITTAVPFLQMTPDSRTSGLGEAGLGLLPDANQLHWNPSNLAFGEDDLQASISFGPTIRELVPNMYLAYLAVYGKLNDRQAIGGSIRYFSYGEIAYVDSNGALIQLYKPKDLAIDFTFAQKFWKHWSGGISARYIVSYLNGGNNVGGAETEAGQSFAIDLSMSYVNLESRLGSKDLDIVAGFTFSNIGSKMYYTDTSMFNTNSSEKDFLPTNLRLGSGFNLHLNDKNQLSWEINLNKLLVPTPPIYARDSTGTIIKDSEGNDIIEAGRDSHVGVAQGMIQSFYDAPYGFSEELKEITLSTGIEYWYAQLFAVRAGYFYENPFKGNRQYITLGAGVRYHVFSLDFSYFISTQQRNGLDNTFRLTLMLTFENLKEKNYDLKDI